MPSTWLNWLKAFTPLPGHDSHQGHRVSEILRPGCSALSRSREHQFRQCGAAHLDQATLESGQLAVAKLLLVRFAGGQRVGESKVLQFWWKTDVEPARHAEEEWEVEPGSVVSDQHNLLLLLECRAPPAHLQIISASSTFLPAALNYLKKSPRTAAASSSAARSSPRRTKRPFLTFIPCTIVAPQWIDTVGTMNLAIQFYTSTGVAKSPHNGCRVAIIARSWDWSRCT